MSSETGDVNKTSERTRGKTRHRLTLKLRNTPRITSPFDSSSRYDSSGAMNELGTDDVPSLPGRKSTLFNSRRPSRMTPYLPWKSFPPSLYHPVEKRSENDVSEGPSESFTQTKAEELPQKISDRRPNINASELTLGLDDLSVEFLDLVLKAKCRDWLKSLSLRDPRFCIKTFFEDVAREGAASIDDPTGSGFHPELLSPLLSMFQRSSIFSVWRPTSLDSIRKMMRGHGVGKGLDIKGKSAKRGKLSAFVPFLQIHEERHKTKIRALPSGGRIRVFYQKEVPRDNAYDFLVAVMKDMVGRVAERQKLKIKANRDTHGTDAVDDDSELSIFADFRVRRLSLEVADSASDSSESWKMDNPSIIKVDDYSPACFGIDMPQRLFWESYVMRAPDISRPIGSEFDSGRPSQPGFQDMNFASIKDDFDPQCPRAVVWQYTDPYLPPTEPDPDPMLPHTLLMAYEEHGRVLPVVSDFDCFLLGTRGVSFSKPLPDEQIYILLDMIDDIEQILNDRSEGKCKTWTASWLKNMKSKSTHPIMPKYGFGDPKSYEIMKHAVHRLEEFGAVRHGAECFNYYFPQDLDDEYLVIGGNLDGAKYKYMKLNELQNFLFKSIDKGFTFPLNPKWVLCDKGWKVIWDKLLASTQPNVEASLNVWCPPHSGLRERIESIHNKYPDGFEADLGQRKQGTAAWDAAEMDLDKYQRIQKAKRKLLCVLCWISVLQQSHKKARQKVVNVEDALHAGERKLNAKRANDTLWETEEPLLEEKHGLRTVNESKSNSVVHGSGDRDCFEADFKVIQSLLVDRRQGLSRPQSAALRRLSEMVQLPSYQSFNHVAPSLRRHTSYRLNEGTLEPVPLFIIQEYGGAEASINTLPTRKPMFRSSVQTVIAARRFIEIANDPAASNVYFLPGEWKRLDRNSKEHLAKKLTFNSLSCWDFNVLEIGKKWGSPLLFTGWAILGSPHAQKNMAKDLGFEHRDGNEDNGYDFVREFNIDLRVLCEFLRLTESNYPLNPYHNSTHVADVLVTLNTILQLGGLYFASTLHVFSLLVAAIIHDVKHPGLNNNFQINTKSDIAILYNDVSVLENQSVAWFFSKMIGKNRDHAINIFSGLTTDQFIIARSVIVKSVLDTDMSHHFLMMAKITNHQEHIAHKQGWLVPYTHHGCAFDPSLDLLCFLLHLSDISNPAKPNFLWWADAVMTEFYAQGDIEASMSLPVSPFCDRATTGKKQSQLGFVKFVVKPAFSLLSEIIPEVTDVVLPCIEDTLEYWENYEEEDLSNIK